MKNLITHTRARFDFEVLDTSEAGIELLGMEVKALRSGKGKLEGAHVVVRGGEAYLVGASIPPHQAANAPGYDPERTRRLLLSREEIRELGQKSDQKGLTIVPISVYSSGSNIKLKIAIARGKKREDKRQTLRKRDTDRHIERTLKNQ
jgi:SsrA-binding protein